MICKKHNHFLTCKLINFNLRQLWFYNLGIHHTAEKQGYMFCWIEGATKRGSREIGSCLLKFIQQNCPTWDELVLWSDSCGGQNCNRNIMCLLLSIVNDDSLQLKKITHRFMWSGHSYLPNDCDFSHIEKRKKAAVAITRPQQYIHLMKSARKSKSYHVYQMEKEDMLDISKLAGNYSKPKKDSRDQPVKLLQMHEMIYERGFSGYHYRHSFFDSEVTTVEIQDSRQCSSNCTITSLPVAYPDVVPISHKKYQDLQELIKYVPPVDQHWLVSLKHDASNNDPVHPDLQWRLCSQCCVVTSVLFVQIQVLPLIQ